ncbi:MAG TPA: peptide chain release factor N(5)-glutamine methyltransferase [Puia sp.]|jgi:release factor glutamine methyltransferase|nr:peptide chain release factor N(5)-glutamine methyltransferase [Puia sp.]
MNLQRAQTQLAIQLTPLYGSREAGLIADWVMEKLTGLKRIDRLVHTSEPLSAPILEQYENYRDQLLAHRPVQYVLHESWFAGWKFYVDENVLIPRPETEELVEWTAQTIASASQTGAADTPSPSQTGALLDVGTGSGCIAIALAKKLPSLSIHACDVSSEALGVAQRNATQLNADIRFHQLDFLDPRQWTDLPPIRWLVSNPPYIPLSERSAMAPHVTGAEPSLALFVPDADPLVFYRALSEFARQKLLPGGNIFVEIHEDLASAAVDLFKTAGFQKVILRKDMQGRDRMIRVS